MICFVVYIILEARIPNPGRNDTLEQSKTDSAVGS